MILNIKTASLRAIACRRVGRAALAAIFCLYVLTCSGRCQESLTPRPGLTSPDLGKLKSVSSVRVSPDGKYVAYSGAGFWIYDVASDNHLPAGKEVGSVSSPRWSPDSRRIAFIGRAGERSGLVFARVAEDGSISAPEFLASISGTNHPLPETGEPFAWSPDSTRIVYVSSVPGPEGDEANGDPRVITRYLFKSFSGGAYNDNRRLQLFVVDLTTKQTRQLTHAPYHHHSVNWSKADEILFASNQGQDPDRVFNDDVFALDVAKGTVRRLTDTPGLELGPAWSPDGTAIALRAAKRPRASSETRMEDDHVWVMKPDGTGKREVGQAIDNRQFGFQWSGDGEWLYFPVAERGGMRLYRLPASGSGAPEAIEPPPPQSGKITAWSLSRTGVLAYAISTLENPGELYLRMPGAPTSRRITALNDAFLSTRRLAKTERFTFPAEGGLEVEAFLTKPLEIDADAKHPMIVVCHGGPHSVTGTQFQFPFQFYAARGYAVLMVNFRGSVGYGQKFADGTFGDQNGAEARDVLKGVDMALAKYPWIDASRLGIEGGSYGGQLTNWIVTQTDRFQAAISVAGISNLVSFNYTAYYHDYLPVEFGAYPHEGDLMDRLFQRSPIRHVARVKTPVMFLHGEQDNDVPITEDQQFFIALKDVGVDTVMVLYPGEGHGIASHKHQIDVLERSAAWYEKYFNGGGKDNGNRKKTESTP